jgi:hypothetical protein
MAALPPINKLAGEAGGNHKIEFAALKMNAISKKLKTQERIKKLS